MGSGVVEFLKLDMTMSEYSKVESASIRPVRLRLVFDTLCKRLAAIRKTNDALMELSDALSELNDAQRAVAL